MKTESFFVIKKGHSPIFYFRNLERATEMFKNLCDGDIVEIEDRHVNKAVKADKDGWRDYDYFHYIKGKSTFALEIEHKEIHEEKEIDEIEKERKKKIKELGEK